jgi:hypothetical protein
MNYEKKRKNSCGDSLGILIKCALSNLLCGLIQAVRKVLKTGTETRLDPVGRTARS